MVFGEDIIIFGILCLWQYLTGPAGSFPQIFPDILDISHNYYVSIEQVKISMKFAGIQTQYVIQKFE